MPLLPVRQFRPMTPRRRLVGGAALALSTMLASCGGDGSSDPAPVATPSPIPSPTPSPSPSPSSSDDLGVPDICAGAVADQPTALTFTVARSSLAITSARPVAGVNFRAFITSNTYALARSRQDDDDASFFRQSYQATFIYGQPEIDAIKAWGATTVRFQISQTLLAANDAT